jgi:hypothetical protein
MHPAIPAVADRLGDTVIEALSVYFGKLEP